jgi:hypothetical protein
MSGRWRALSALACLLLAASPALADQDWGSIKSWVYQLTNYKDGKLDRVSKESAPDAGRPLPNQVSPKQR